MAHTAQRSSIDSEHLRSIQSALRERDLDGWLLYDYHSTNPVAGRVLGLEQPLTRRYFVLLPAEGRPVAVAHALERAPWSDWPGPVRIYFTWQELEATLAETLTPGQRIALEYSEVDRIPQLDRMPAGVLDLVRRAGVHPNESSELVTLFSSAWSEAELESHRRTARTLANVAATAFAQASEAVRDSQGLSEWELKQSIVGALTEVGLEGVDAIVALGPNSANGHYEPTAQRAAPIEADRVLLIDLWGRQKGSVFADQTWMGYTGAVIPEPVQKIWRTVFDARTAAVEYLKNNTGNSAEVVRGCDVDEACRSVIREAGFGDAFVHRTGHSIDSELHGLGPNIDSVETRDERRLLAGIGFSIEPGVYLAGEFGIRSEINVHLSEAGPEVTTPNPQTHIYALLSEGWKTSNAT